jgi:L-amino acid N-acyltransferase YncA
MKTRAQEKTRQEIRIRQASDADRGMILAMYEDFEPRGETVGMPPAKELEEWLDAAATSPNFLAVTDGEVVGHGWVRPEGEAGEVAVYVHQNYRRRGIGRRLLTTLIEEARHLHLGRVWGMADASNAAMFQLARSAGFAQQKDPQMYWLTIEPPDESRLVVTSPPLPQD